MASTSLLTDLNSVVNSIPIITRSLLISTLVFSVLSLFGLVSPMQLILMPLSFKTLSTQAYRLITCHLWASNQQLLWHCFMLYQNSLQLEIGHFATKRGGYSFAIACLMLTLDLAGFVMGWRLLTESFGMAITTIYSLVRGDQTVSFMFGLQFKAKFLPWVMLIFGMIMGGGWEQGLLGIAVGYLYFYAEKDGYVVVPEWWQQMNPEPPRIQDASGSVTNPGTSAGARFRGKGHRLGS